MSGWRKLPDRSGVCKRKITQEIALSYQQSSEFSGKPSFFKSIHSGRTILKRVQLDKRRIKLIRPRSESSRALQSRGKPEAGRAGPLNEWHRFFRVKANPRFPSSALTNEIVDPRLGPVTRSIAALARNRPLSPDRIDRIVRSPGRSTRGIGKRVSRRCG